MGVERRDPGFRKRYSGVGSLTAPTRTALWDILLPDRQGMRGAAKSFEPGSRAAVPRRGPILLFSRRQISRSEARERQRGGTAV